MPIAVFLFGGDLLLSRLRRSDLRRMSALVGYVVTESGRELLAVIGKKLRIVRSARDGDIGHAVVEQVFRTQLRVHMHQNPLGSLALTGMAGYRIAVIEMRVPCWIDCDMTAIVHLQLNTFLISNGCYGS